MTEATSVVRFDRLLAEHHPQVGGKCASLGTMGRAGLPVPPGFAVTTQVFSAAKEASGCWGEINALINSSSTTAVGSPDGANSSNGTGATSGTATVERRSAEQARDRVRSWTFDPDHEAKIRESYAALCRLCGTEDVPVAVRSSATSEDSPDASFAGEHDTYLWVCGIDAVLDSIKACWSSLYTDRAIAYRNKMGYDHDQVDMAVAVQKMVRPRSAGVAFTLDPTNGDKSGICIDAAWGFGEGVVSGDVSPDNFLVDKVMWSINRRTISAKTHAHMLVHDDAQRWPRVERIELPEEKVNSAALSDAEIVRVAKLARSAEKHYGCAQDIEWAVDDDLPEGDDVVLLQSRPETTWSKKKNVVHADTNRMSSIVNTLVNPVHERKGRQPA